MIHDYAKTPHKKLITANDLLSGRPVYLAADRRWTAALSQAQIFEGDVALQALQWAQRDAGREVVGPYLMEVDERGRPIERGRLREEIRHAGPTIAYGRAALEKAA